MDDQGNSTAAGDVRREAHDALTAWPHTRARAQVVEREDRATPERPAVHLRPGELLDELRRAVVLALAHGAPVPRRAARVAAELHEAMADDGELLEPASDALRGPWDERRSDDE